MLKESVFQASLPPCAQPYLTLRDAVGCSPPRFSVHGIPQARILEWAAISSCIWQVTPWITKCWRKVYFRFPSNFKMIHRVHSGLINCALFSVSLCPSHSLFCWILLDLLSLNEKTYECMFQSLPLLQNSNLPIARWGTYKHSVIGQAFSDSSLQWFCGEWFPRNSESVLDVRYRTSGFFEVWCTLFTGLLTWFIHVLNMWIQVYFPESLALIYWVWCVEKKKKGWIRILWLLCKSYKSFTFYKRQIYVCSSLPLSKLPNVYKYLWLLLKF